MFYTLYKENARLRARHAYKCVDIYTSRRVKSINQWFRLKHRNVVKIETRGINNYEKKKKMK